MKKKVLNGKKTLTNDLIDIVSEKIQTPGERILEIPLEKIREKKNVRKEYKSEDIQEMAKSIKQKGLLQPITVIQSEDGYYDIVFGHRRFKGMMYLHENEPEKFMKINCIVKEKDSFDPAELTEIQLVENIQRENLSAIELKEGLEVLKAKGLTHKEIAEKLGKKEGYVKNMFKAVNTLNKNEELNELVKSDTGVTLADIQTVKPLPAKQQIELIEEKISGTIKTRAELQNRVWQIKETLSAENKEYRTHREQDKFKILDYSVRHSGFKVKSFQCDPEKINYDEAKNLYKQMQIIQDKLIEIMKSNSKTKGHKNDRNK